MPFQCEFCEKYYSYQKNLNSHLRKAHRLEKGITSFPFDTHKHKCLEGCLRSFRLISDLRYHLKQDHGKEMNPELLAFRSMRDFKIWFDNLTKNNNVTYFRGSTTKSGIYFFCNRSGISRVKDLESRKRALKKQGSCKIQHSCTNQIILLEKDGQILVTYFKDHYGHEEEVQHLRLPRKDILLLASKMASGVSPARIISEAHRERDCNNMKRVDLVNRKDLCNIKRALGLKTAELKEVSIASSCVGGVSDPKEFADIQLMTETNNTEPEENSTVVNMRTKLFDVLKKIRNECAAIDDQKLLVKLYEKLNTSLIEIVEIKKRDADTQPTAQDGGTVNSNFLHSFK